MTIKFYNKNFYSTIYNLRHNSSFINSQQNGVKLKITNLNTIKDNFSSVEIRNINRELNFFGVNLLYINGLSLNIELKDGLINISQESLQSLNTQQENDVLNFIKVFNKGIKSNNPNYLLNNTKFYLLNYRNKNLILTLDQIDDLRVNKKCFDLDGNLIVKVKDTLKSNGELSREDENSILIYKGTDIIFAEKKQKIRFSVIPFRITHQFYKNWWNNKPTNLLHSTEKALKKYNQFLSSVISNIKVISNISWKDKNLIISLLIISFSIVAGFLDPSLLSLFINNPENWNIAQIIPKNWNITESISESISGVSTYTESISKFISENFIEILNENPEILNENPEELVEKEKVIEKESTNWKTIALLGLIFGILMYAVIKHNTAIEITEVIDNMSSSNRSSMINGIIDCRGNPTSLTINTLAKLLEDQGHFFVGGMPLSDTEALFKTLVCPNDNLMRESLSLLGSINSQMFQAGREGTYEIPVLVARDLINFIERNKETLTEVLGSTEVYAPIVRSP